ncbi:MAG: hypothetical protein QM751_13940 [Paludibacteraceae bacterium]
MKLILFFFFPIFSFGQIKLDQKVNLLDGKVTIFCPKELSEMTAEMWKIKYGNAQRPVLALSDVNIEVNLLAQYTNQNWEEKKIAEYKDIRIANLKKTRTDIQILKEGVTDINGKKVGFFKFMIQAIDSKVFNYYFFTIVDAKILTFTFNCKETLRNGWEKIADEIANSLTVK